METRNYHENITKGFERLGTHINVERGKFVGEINEKSVVKESIRSLSQEIKQATPATTSAPVDPLHVIPEYAETESEAVKQEIERIVELAANQGIETGIRESMKHPAFIQDAFHDALVDKLIPELKQRGII